MAMSIARPAKAISPRVTLAVASPATTGTTAGFTLLEVMVAVAVIAIALVPLLRLHLLSLDATMHAQDLTIAVGLAQEKMSGLPDKPEPGENKGEFEGTAFERFRWQTSVGEKEEIDIPNLDDPDGNEVSTLEIQRIEVTVIWLDGQREKLYTLESYAVH